MELHVVNIMHPKDFKNSQFFYNLLYPTRLHPITYPSAQTRTRTYFTNKEN